MPRSTDQRDSVSIHALGGPLSADSEPGTYLSPAPVDAPMGRS